MQPNPLAEMRADFLDSATGRLDYDRVVKEIIEYVKSVDPLLDLSTLKSVRASSDYRGLLRTISEEQGRTVVATERGGGVGMAMVVHEEDGDVLALHLGLLDGVFDADLDMMQRTVNLFHHELSHVHDAAAKRRMFDGSWLKLRVSGASHRLFPVADAVWCEYFADRRSYPTWPGGEHVHAAMLATQIPAVHAAVKGAIGTFRRHASVAQLLDEVMPHISFLFMLTGYVMGTMKASGGSLEELDAAIAAAVRGSYLEPAWEQLDIELDRMYQAHGQWPGISVYAPLEAIVSAVMVRLGLELTTRDGLPHLNVPFTLETAGP